MKQRQCRTCKEYFLLNERCFYKRDDGSFYTQCKKCYGEKGKIKRQERKQRLNTRKAINDEYLDGFKLGRRYRVTSVSRGKKDNNRFTGEVIQHDKRLLTLEDHRGLRETFLKIDFVIGEYGIQTL